MAGSLTGRLTRGLLNAGWRHHRDGTQDKWTAPGGDIEVSVDAPPGTDLKVVDAHRRGMEFYLRAFDGDTDTVIRGLAAFKVIPPEVTHEA